jgi:hypothetical protein
MLAGVLAPRSLWVFLGFRELFESPGGLGTVPFHHPQTRSQTEQAAARETSQNSGVRCISLGCQVDVKSGHSAEVGILRVSSASLAPRVAISERERAGHRLVLGRGYQRGDHALPFYGGGPQSAGRIGYVGVYRDGRASRNAVMQSTY